MVSVSLGWQLTLLLEYIYVFLLCSLSALIIAVTLRWMCRLRSSHNLEMTPTLIVYLLALLACNATLALDALIIAVLWRPGKAHSSHLRFSSDV